MSAAATAASGKKADFINLSLYGGATADENNGGTRSVFLNAVNEPGKRRNRFRKNICFF